MPLLIGMTALTAYRAEATRIAAYQMQFGPQASAKEAENVVSEAVPQLVSGAASECAPSQAAIAMSIDGVQAIEGNQFCRTTYCCTVRMNKNCADCQLT